MKPVPTQSGRQHENRVVKTTHFRFSGSSEEAIARMISGWASPRGLSVPLDRSTGLLQKKIFLQIICPPGILFGSGYIDTTFDPTHNVGTISFFDSLTAKEADDVSESILEYLGAEVVPDERENV